MSEHNKQLQRTAYVPDLLEERGVKQPTMQYWTWSRSLPQFAVMAILIAAFWPLFPIGEKTFAVLSAAAVYLGYSQVSRLILTSKHRKGLKEAALKNYDQSIHHFRESVEFFSSHNWLDKYRSVFLLTASVWTYQEMGLLSIAANYSSQGDIEAARATLETLVEKFPQNEHARSSLRFIRAATSAVEA